VRAVCCAVCALLPAQQPKSSKQTVGAKTGLTAERSARNPGLHGADGQAAAQMAIDAAHSRANLIRSSVLLADRSIQHGGGHFRDRMAYRRCAGVRSRQPRPIALWDCRPVSTQREELGIAHGNPNH